MSVEFYTILHLVGIFIVILSLGGMTLHVLSGGTKQYAGRKWAAAWHGLGLLLVLIAGFGLLAKEHILEQSMPAWVIGKLIVWVILGAIPVLIYRQPKLAKLFWILILALAGFAAYLAIVKPA